MNLAPLIRQIHGMRVLTSIPIILFKFNSGISSMGQTNVNTSARSLHTQFAKSSSAVSPKKHHTFDIFGNTAQDTLF
jgi:hypothetical protein